MNAFTVWVRKVCMTAAQIARELRHPRWPSLASEWSLAGFRATTTPRCERALLLAIGAAEAASARERSDRRWAIRELFRHAQRLALAFDTYELGRMRVMSWCRLMEFRRPHAEAQDEQVRAKLAQFCVKERWMYHARILAEQVTLGRFRERDALKAWEREPTTDYGMCRVEIAEWLHE